MQAIREVSWTRPVAAGRPAPPPKLEMRLRHEIRLSMLFTTNLHPDAVTEQMSCESDPMRILVCHTPRPWRLHPHVAGCRPRVDGIGLLGPGGRAGAAHGVPTVAGVR